MKKQLLTLGFYLVLATANCADHNPIALTANMPTAAACAPRKLIPLRFSKRTKLNDLSEQLRNSEKVNQGSIPQKSGDSSTVGPDLAVTLPTACAAASAETASTTAFALASASHTPPGTDVQPQPASAQTRLEEFNNLRASKQGEELQGRIREALDEKYFAVQEDDAASCTRKNRECIQTDYVPARVAKQKYTWKLHCMMHHLPQADQDTLRSFLNDAGQRGKHQKLFACPLCSKLKNVVLSAALYHIAAHFLGES